MDNKAEISKMVKVITEALEKYKKVHFLFHDRKIENMVSKNILLFIHKDHPEILNKSIDESDGLPRLCNMNSTNPRVTGYRDINNVYTYMTHPWPEKHDWDIIESDIDDAYVVSTLEYADHYMDNPIWCDKLQRLTKKHRFMAV